MAKTEKPKSKTITVNPEAQVQLAEAIRGRVKELGSMVTDLLKEKQTEAVLPINGQIKALNGVLAELEAPDQKPAAKEKATK